MYALRDKDFSRGADWYEKNLKSNSEFQINSGSIKQLRIEMTQLIAKLSPMFLSWTRNNKTQEMILQQERARPFANAFGVAKDFGVVMKDINEVIGSSGATSCTAEGPSGDTDEAVETPLEEAGRILNEVIGSSGATYCMAAGLSGDTDEAVEIPLEEAGQILCFGTEFYHFFKNNRKQLDELTCTTPLFEKKFIFIPWMCNGIWSVLVLVNPGKIKKDGDCQACMVLLVSRVHAGKTELEVGDRWSLREWLCEEHKKSNPENDACTQLFMRNKWFPLHKKTGESFFTLLVLPLTFS